MKVALKFTVGATGIVAENTFVLEDDSDAIFADFIGVRDAIASAVTTNLLPVTYSNTNWIGVELTDIRTVPFGGGDFVFPTAHVGTLTSTHELPTSVCLAIKKETGLAGRSHRGRWYWYLMDQATLASRDVADATYIGDVEAALGAFKDDIEVALSPALMGIVSYQENKVPRLAGLFEQIVDFTHADLNVDSQRRRLLGRGR